MQQVGGKRGVIYMKEQLLAQAWLDIQCLGLNAIWELENYVDIAAMRLQTLCPECIHPSSGCNVVTEFHLYNYQASLLCEKLQHILLYSCQLLTD